MFICYFLIQIWRYMPGYHMIGVSKKSDRKHIFEWRFTITCKGLGQL